MWLQETKQTGSSNILSLGRNGDKAYSPRLPPFGIETCLICKLNLVTRFWHSIYQKHGSEKLTGKGVTKQTVEVALSDPCPML